MAVLLLAAACSRGAPQPAGATGDASPAPAACAALFRAGAATPPHAPTGDAGIFCMSPAGGMYGISGWRCRDGGYLWTPTAGSGANGWGRAGQPFHPVAGETAADPGYAAALTACIR